MTIQIKTKNCGTAKGTSGWATRLIENSELFLGKTKTGLPIVILKAKEFLTVKSLTLGRTVSTHRNNFRRPT